MILKVFSNKNDPMTAEDFAQQAVVAQILAPFCSQGLHLTHGVQKTA